MKFGELLEEAMRQDWAANYVNYKRAKDHIKGKCDVPTYKEFIENECAKAERFYALKLEELTRQSGQLTTMMSDKSAKNTQSMVSVFVKASWEHTQDLRGLYDFCKLCAEGIRKSLKKYDKVLKKDLQTTYLQSLRTKYVFFKFRDTLTDLLKTCAGFWNEDLSRAATSADMVDALPANFPLAGQMQDQAKGADLESESDIPGPVRLLQALR